MSEQAIPADGARRPGKPASPPRRAASRGGQVWASARSVGTNRWLRFAVRRAAGLVATLLLLLIVTFAMVQLVPGNPGRLILGTKASPQSVAGLDHRLGLDLPLLQQFLRYASGAIRLHFGTSFATGQPVSQVLLERLPYTLWLDGVALAILLVLGLGAGMAAAVATRDGRHHRIEMLFMVATGIGGAIPSYLAATFLAYLFAVLFRLLPVSGVDQPTSVVLPALSLAIPLAMLLARIVRVECLNVFAQDYIRTAKSKRLKSFRVYMRYILPNVLNSALALGGILFIGLIGGTIIVENVFAWPGLGTLIVQSIPKLDYPVIQGTTLLLGLIVVTMNTLVDVARALIDPQTGTHL